MQKSLKEIKIGLRAAGTERGGDRLDKLLHKSSNSADGTGVHIHLNLSHKINLVVKIRMSGTDSNSCLEVRSADAHKHVIF